MNKMNSVPENSLWNLFLEGDKRAFSSLFKHFYPFLYSYGLKISKNEAHTQDTLQTFFIYLYEQREKLGNVNNVKSYLFVSFRRALLLKMKKERKTTELTPLGISNYGFEFSPEELAIDQEFIAAKREVITQILNKLSPREREVIYLKYYSNLPTMEIASVMDISYQSVLNTIQKAFQKLRKMVENEMLIHVLKN